MKTFNSKVSDHLNEVVREFLESQLGENPKRISSNMSSNVLTVYAFGVASPAEETMLHTEIKKLWIDYKSRQFDTVRNMLCEDLEGILNQKIRTIETTMTEDGIRIIHVCFI